MVGTHFSYALLTALATGLLVAAGTDLWRRQISNWLNATIALAAPLFWIATSLTLPEIGFQIAMAAATFAVLSGLFVLGAMGGGDVKLLTALALWIQPAWFPKLLLIMAIAGGILTIIVGAWHVIDRRRGKVAVPYGIAISMAGLCVLVMDVVPYLQAGPHSG